MQLSDILVYNRSGTFTVIMKSPISTDVLPSLVLFLRLFFWKLRLTKSTNASTSAEESLSYVLTRFIYLM